MPGVGLHVTNSSDAVLQSKGPGFLHEMDPPERPPRSLQRQLADSIMRWAPVDDIRVLLASGGNVNEPVTKGLRLLHYAVFHRNVDVVNLLLVRGANPNTMDDVGYTPLHLCAERGYCNLIRILLAYNCRVDFSKIGKDDKPFGCPARASPADEPLRLALKNGHYQAAKLLLKNGANPNANYFMGHEINLINPLDIESLELLLKFGANPNAADRQGMTPLMKACRNPEALDSAHLLISYGADVNAMTDEDQRTAMHYAVLSGNLNLVRLLVDNGAAVQLSPEYAKPPPLFFAVLKGNLDMMNYLIDAGASVNAGSAVVGSALHIALTESVTNKLDIVKTLLEHGADPNVVTVTDSGPVLKPPIGEYLYTCDFPELKLIRLLLMYGARVVLLGQRQHPLGILKSIHRVNARDCADVLDLLTEAAEDFCISLIERSVLLSNRHKLVLLTRAIVPLPLQHIARIEIRKILGWGPALVSAVRSLPIPLVLQKYLLFEE